MKYFRLGPRKAILQIFDVKPSLNSLNIIEVSDEKAAEAKKIKINQKIPIWWNNNVTTFQSEMEKGYTLSWDAENKDYIRNSIVEIVPAEITLWRAKSVLLLNGLLSAVESEVQSLSGDEGNIIKTAWNNGVSLNRNSLTIKRIAEKMNLTDEKIDNLFIQANKLEI